MDRRFLVFIVASFTLILAHGVLMNYFFPQKPPIPAVQPIGGANGNAEGADAKAATDANKGKLASDQGGGEKNADNAAGASAEGKSGNDAPGQETSAEAKLPTGETKSATASPDKAAVADVEPPIPQQWVTIGSADPADPYRMLVTLTNRGAALVRAEMNSPRYREQTDDLGLVDRSGYLGHIAGEAISADGVPVEIVGAGTPAAAAGLRAAHWVRDGATWRREPGDVIREVNGHATETPGQLQAALRATEPGQKAKITVLREGKDVDLTVALGSRPLQVIRPEHADPLSMRLTLGRLDNEKLAVPETAEDTITLGGELKGLDLWTANWEIVEADQEHARFRRRVPGTHIDVEKLYRLEKIPQANQSEQSFPAYHLLFDVTLHNADDASHTVAYQLDGPNGLPTEGFWYAMKVSRDWGPAGLRDVAVSFNGQTPLQVRCPAIASGKVEKPWRDQMVTYIGVDAQYFSAILLPHDQKDNWFANSHPLRVGQSNKELPSLTNTSVRLMSETHELPPGASLTNEFRLFVGPKRAELLAHYGLEELLYYGWFSWIAKPMVWLLHGLYAIIGNYGLAIILLTVIVRGAMFPVSRHQVQTTQKMQELQPEIKRIQEKYKNDLEARTKAQQDLFRKHNHNPLSGCLVAFIQVPIFMALYRTLMVDIDLRQAPLISESIRWCSNLAAPDMLYDWHWAMPDWFNLGHGMFALGPYFNLLPLLTIGLFIAQQKMLMPPPTDEQQAMQQKMMQYMMIFMGVLFFKVASGLCIYFIASSVWGLAERQFLPKSKPADVPAEPQTRADAKAEQKRINTEPPVDRGRKAKSSKTPQERGAAKAANGDGILDRLRAMVAGQTEKKPAPRSKHK